LDDLQWELLEFNAAREWRFYTPKNWGGLSVAFRAYSVLIAGWRPAAACDHAEGLPQFPTTHEDGGRGDAWQSLIKSASTRWDRARYTRPHDSVRTVG
jgi:hypothetical protein